MADIILAGDSFSLKKLQSAADKLEDAQNLMQQVYDAVYSTSFWAEANPFALLDGDKNMNVFDGTINELQSCQRSVQQKEENLRTLTQQMKTAIQELVDTDQSFSGKLSGKSGKSIWEHLKSTIGIFGQSSSTTAILLIGAINSLFASDAAIGGETIVDLHENVKPMTRDELDKQAIYAQYKNDSYIDTTELKMIIETSKNAEEAKTRINNVRTPKQKAEMRERYISQTAPNADYWGEYYNNWYNDIVSYGCFVSSISMAISSMGKDCLPADICKINQEKLEPWNPTLCAHSAVADTYGLKLTSPENLDIALNKYQENPEVYSPPIIRTTGTNGNLWHYVTIIGKLEDGRLIARDPAIGDKIIRAYEVHQIIQYVD